MGKMIHNRLFDKNGKNSMKKNEMFINGRTLFIFDLDEGVLPTTVVKSKDDLPKFKVNFILFFYFYFIFLFLFYFVYFCLFYFIFIFCFLYCFFNYF